MYTMVRERERESRRTYNSLRTDIFRLVDVKFGMTGIGLPPKYLYYMHKL